MTGDTGRLTLARVELFGTVEPDVHPFVQIPRSALPVPAVALRRSILRNYLADGDSHEQGSNDDGCGQPHSFSAIIPLDAFRHSKTIDKRDGAHNSE